jgi:hypothetical protein
MQGCRGYKPDATLIIGHRRDEHLKAPGMQRPILECPNSGERIELARLRNEYCPYCNRSIKDGTPRPGVRRARKATRLGSDSQWYWALPHDNSGLAVFVLTTLLVLGIGFVVWIALLVALSL